MSKEHYYLMIDKHYVSEIQRAESPTRAISKTSWSAFEGRGPKLNDKGCKWRVFEGRADHHYIAYQFYFSGPMTGRAANIVDLGSVNAYDAPGLPKERLCAPCPQLRKPCPLQDDPTCARDLDILP